MRLSCGIFSANPAAPAQSACSRTRSRRKMPSTGCASARAASKLVNMSDLVPFTVISSVAVLDSSSSGWKLLDVAATQPRNHRFEVTFERAFACPPLVHVGIAGLDVSNEDNLRVRVRAVDITVDGFSIEAETWFNTRVWAVDVAWIAIGP